MFTWDEAARAHLQSNVENALEASAMDQSVSLATSLSMTPFELVRGTRRPPVKELVSRIEGCELTTKDSHFAAQEAMRLLRSTPLKCIYFSRDVRPPYVGTYTKFAEESSRVARQPFRRIRTDTDYDYDSEEDWEEPEEGEDLGSDAGSDADSGAETDDLEGFLDDEDTDGSARRRFLVGDMEPVSSGLCWENLEAQQDSLSNSMREFKLTLLLGTHCLQRGHG
jgi:chromatin assembly factor 1 subunit A